MTEEKKSFYKAAMALCIPVALQNLINVGVTAADVLMLSWLGEDVLAGSGLGGQFQYILNMVFFGLTSGLCVLTAQYWGSKNMEAIQRSMAIAFRIAIFVSLVFLVVIRVFPHKVILLYTSDPPVIDSAVEYLKIVCFSYPFIAVSMIYLYAMRSMERVKVAVVVYGSSLAINVVLNALLIYGLLGFPRMGIAGAAMATLISRIWEMLAVLWYNKYKNDLFCFRISRLWQFDRCLQRDFIRYSTPVVLNELLWGLATSLNTAVLGHMSSYAFAAYSVVSMVRQLAAVLYFGLGAATSVLLGKTIGEKREDLASVYGDRFVKISFQFGVLGAIIMLIIHPIVNAFLPLEQETLDYLGPMLYYIALTMVAHSYNCTMIVGVFRAGGDTRVGLYIDLGTLWLVTLPLGFIAGMKLHWPVLIVFMILYGDEFLKMPLSALRYRSRKWLNNVTRDISEFKE
ncbi:MAG: MATE family efflux transporter [Oscillospiraceae bacterium]|nr:MATE family efflux transporter [Oscillospiraceae bacterium]